MENIIVDATEYSESRWSAYADPTGRVLNVMNDIQERYRYLPEPALDRISQLSGISLRTLKQMARFFDYLSLDPVGKVVIDVCDGTACHTQGAPLLAQELQKLIGIAPGETTADGAITLRTVGCVGACGIAPIVSVEGKLYGRVRISRIPEIAKDAEACADNSGGETS